MMLLVDWDCPISKHKDKTLRCLTRVPAAVKLKYIFIYIYIRSIDEGRRGPYIPQFQYVASQLRCIYPVFSHHKRETERETENQETDWSLAVSIIYIYIYTEKREREDRHGHLELGRGFCWSADNEAGSDSVTQSPPRLATADQVSLPWSGAS